MRKEEKKTWISRSSSADKKEVKERDLRKKVEFGQRAPVDGISGPWDRLKLGGANISLTSF